MPPQTAFYIGAKLSGFDSVQNSLFPVLRAYITIRIAAAGPRSGLLNQHVSRPNDATAAAPRAVHIQSISAGLYWRQSHQENPGRLLSVGLLDPAGGHGTEIEVDSELNNPVQIVFPFTTAGVANLEDLRAGRDATFGIKVSLRAIAWQVVNPVPIIEPWWVDGLDVTGEQQSPVLKVPRSAWIDSYLPGLRQGRWRTVELPVSDDVPLRGIDERLVEAQRHFDAGEWRACVSSSRVVIQELEPLVRKLVNPALSDRPAARAPEDAATKAAAVTESFKALAGGMLDFQGKIFALLSPAVHATLPDTVFERPDAELALGFAMLCRQYVGRRIIRHDGIAPQP